MPHHLHPAGIVPDIQRHRAARPHDAPHFRKRARRIRNEIQDEVRDGGIDRAIRQRQRLSIADPEGQAQIAHMRPRVVEIAGRGIDREHRSRRAVVEDGPAQRAGAAPDVEPREAGRQHQPMQERAGDGPAPPPHIRLVRIAGGPHICGRFRNHGRAPCPTRENVDILPRTRGVCSRIRSRYTNRMETDQCGVVAACGRIRSRYTHLSALNRSGEVAACGRIRSRYTGGVAGIAGISLRLVAASGLATLPAS